MMLLLAGCGVMMLDMPAKQNQAGISRVDAHCVEPAVCAKVTDTVNESSTEFAQRSAGPASIRAA
jgi:hypothetical protein